jgi:hypothetical protein
MDLAGVSRLSLVASRAVRPKAVRCSPVQSGALRP